MPAFKIAAAQVPSVRGDIDANIATHAAAIKAAAKQDVSVLVFPELSLTGYEPDLAAELAMTPDDGRLGLLAALARQNGIQAVVGAPLRGSGSKPNIGAILIDASGTTKGYRKMHLGTSERPWFEPGDQQLAFSTSGHKVGLAICADTSQPSHPRGYAENGADIYAAGVMLNAEWYQTDMPRLVGYAAQFRMLVVMANQAASVGSYASVGKSSVWAPGGALLVQAERTENALVIASSEGAEWRGGLVTI
jgi:predicted amidohydrolase